MRTLLLGTLAALLLSGAVQAETLYFIHVDHLGTPRLAVGEDGVERWRWEQAEPFGGNAAIELPGTEGYLINLPLRFPGQYMDKETNTHYNYFRDYDPAIGRYIQSDPIGLKGGIGTYNYVLNNPLRWADPRGLDVEAPPSKPPVLPPNTPPSGGRPDCAFLGGATLSKRGSSALYWPPIVTRLCRYYCGPLESCPANPDDYVVSIVVESLQLLPGFEICPPTIPNPNP